MTLKLYFHPLSSFCQKALIAFYEREVPFEAVTVELSDPDQKAVLQAVWPLGKFPVLRDEEKGVTVPESSIIIEYLDGAWPAPAPLIPTDPETARRVRLWDRIFDNYIELPMQKVVGDSFRPDDGKDPVGVQQAKELIAQSWALLEAHLGLRGTEWAVGDSFTLADCAAAPALFYANIVQPFAGHARVEAYYKRLLARPSFARCVEEAKPYWHYFPLEWPENYR